MKYNGLHKKPTYDSLIDYIQNKQPILKYPNRLATEIMNSRELSKLNGIGISLDQQDNLMKEQQRINLIRESSINNGTTFSHNIAAASRNPSTIGFDDVDSRGSSSPFVSQYSHSDFFEFIDEEVDDERQNRLFLEGRGRENTEKMLRGVSQQGDSSVIHNIMISNKEKRIIASQASKEYISDLVPRLDAEVDKAKEKRIIGSQASKEYISDLVPRLDAEVDKAKEKRIIASQASKEYISDLVPRLDAKRIKNIKSSSSSSQIPSNLGSSTQMPSYMTGSKIDLNNFGIEIFSSIPIIPFYWGTTLKGEETAVKKRLENEYKYQSLNQLKGVYKILSGVAHKSANVGKDTLIKYIVYLRMETKDY